MIFVDVDEKKRILEDLRKNFGIEKVGGILIKFGEKRIRLYTGGFSVEQLRVFDKYLRIESIGLYIASFQAGELRLTIEGAQFFSKQIKNNILDISERDFERWFRGEDLYLKAEKGFKILRYGREIIGCGKSTGERITNFVPKNRRVKDN